MKLRFPVFASFVLLAFSPAFAKDRPAGPMVNVGTITCSSTQAATTTEISYFKAGSVSSSSTCSSGGNCQESTTEVLEIHAPLSSLITWNEALDLKGLKTQFSACTISLPGKNGPESLTYQNLVISSVLAIGKRRDHSPRPDYYTDVVFGPANTGDSAKGTWNLQQQQGF